MRPSCSIPFGFTVAVWHASHRIIYNLQCYASIVAYLMDVQQEREDTHTQKKKNAVNAANRWSIFELVVNTKQLLLHTDRLDALSFLRTGQTTHCMPRWIRYVISHLAHLDTRYMNNEASFVFSDIQLNDSQNDSESDSGKRRQWISKCQWPISEHTARPIRYAIFKSVLIIAKR